MANMTLEEINEELEWINSQLKTKSYSIGDKNKENHNFTPLIKRKKELLDMRVEYTKPKKSFARVSFG